MKAPPLAVLGAILLLGVAIEAVERQSRSAAYALIVLLLLGAITFNAGRFSTELARLQATLSAPPSPKRGQASGGGKAGFG
jgi:hypothetical protein